MGVGSDRARHHRIIIRRGSTRGVMEIALRSRALCEYRAMRTSPSVTRAERGKRGCNEMRSVKPLPPDPFYVLSVPRGGRRSEWEFD
jgi:hypothetical protein